MYQTEQLALDSLLTLTDSSPKDSERSLSVSSKTTLREIESSGASPRGVESTQPRETESTVPRIDATCEKEQGFSSSTLTGGGRSGDTDISQPQVRSVSLRRIIIHDNGEGTVHPKLYSFSVPWCINIKT